MYIEVAEWKLLLYLQIGGILAFISHMVAFSWQMAHLGVRLKHCSGLQDRIWLVKRCPFVFGYRQIFTSQPNTHPIFEIFEVLDIFDSFGSFLSF